MHSGIASASSSRQAPASAPTPQKPAKPASKWSDYSTAQSLGYDDPDEDRRNAEFARKQTQGLAGVWEVVAPPPPPLPASNANEEVNEEGDASALDGPSGQAAQQKREAQEEPEDERSFKFRKRTVRPGLGELWDPGDIPVKVKSKPMTPTGGTKEAEKPTKEEDGRVAPIPESSTSLIKGEPSNEATTGEKPSRQPGGWKRATAPVDASSEPYFDPVEPSVPIKDELSPPPPSLAENSEAKVVDNGVPVKAEPELVKKEDAGIASGLDGAHEQATGAMFRKRKVPAGSRGSGRR